MNDVAQKWGRAFASLNRGEPGIVGLISFTEVSRFRGLLLFPLMFSAIRHGC